MLRPVLVAIVFFTSALGGLASEKEQKPATVPKAGPRGAHEYFLIRIGEKPAQLQLAVTSAEMQRGLMERRSLGADEGMIFIYQKPGPMSFWMRNTPLPLDIAFFDANGVMREVYPLYPFDENVLKSRSDDVQFAVEMRQGWFRENGVRPGARLDVAMILNALQARGFNPADFGMRK